MFNRQPGADSGATAVIVAVPTFDKYTAEFTLN